MIKKRPHRASFFPVLLWLRRGPSVFLSVFLFALAACAPTAPPGIVPGAAPEKTLSLEPARFADLQGWHTDNVADAMNAFRRSCRRIIAGSGKFSGNEHFGRRQDWRAICEDSFRVRPGAVEGARSFFEKHFRPWRALAVDKNGSKTESGLFTGYFEPELRGARKKSDRYPVPLLAPPAGLTTVKLGLFDAKLAGRTLTGRVKSGQLLPLPTRAEIERGALSGEGLEILWLADPVDAFFLHIQGSGRVVMETGEVVRVGYGGRNGKPYTAIGRALIEDGSVRREDMSMQAIADWIAKNPKRGRELMEQNASYIFFRIQAGENPIGASGVELTPGRSLAVDTRHVPFGVPVWLESTEPGEGARPLRRLLVAQDTGAAIRGPVRGDFFWGFGADAARKAGQMKGAGGYFLLLPRDPQS